MVARFQAEVSPVTCALCKADALAPGLTTVTLQRDPTTVVIKGVPAEVCGACGEYYLSEDVSRAVMALGEGAVARGAGVEILRFAV